MKKMDIPTFKVLNRKKYTLTKKKSETFVEESSEFVFDTTTTFHLIS